MAKVRVDLKSQLRELLEEMDNLYNALDTTFATLSFEEINEVLIESFRLMLDKKPPIDVVSDASSGELNDDEEYSESENSQEDEEDDDVPEITEEERQAAKEKEVDKIKRMINCMFGPKY